ncbi:TPR repeat [Carpediemonas membranifera]|uniref:TPR repeat n=1 Tax=Carpediemonas membranifera TaxID=201153 RepID=A0A8J6DZP9_9EUKA|nr:TPR repeat [Carpediemonas membranifera]|eukprot:KAG9391043.1 TPR repeat [Carpediemonas membranifera]
MAEQILSRAVRLTEPDTPWESEAARLKYRSITYNNLGVLYKRRGEPTTALSFLERALRLEIENGEVESPAGTHLNLCAILSQLGRHQAAMEHARCSLDLLIDRLRPGEQPPSVLAIAYHNLAVEQEFLGEIDEALKSYDAGVRFATDTLGPGHPTTQPHKAAEVEIRPGIETAVGKAASPNEDETGISKDGPDCGDAAEADLCCPQASVCPAARVGETAAVVDQADSGEVAPRSPSRGKGSGPAQAGSGPYSQIKVKPVESWTLTAPEDDGLEDLLDDDPSMIPVDTDPLDLLEEGSPQPREADGTPDRAAEAKRGRPGSIQIPQTKAEARPQPQPQSIGSPRAKAQKPAPPPGGPLRRPRPRYESNNGMSRSEVYAILAGMLNGDSQKLTESQSTDLDNLKSTDASLREDELEAASPHVSFSADTRQHGDGGGDEGDVLAELDEPVAVDEIPEPVATSCYHPEPESEQEPDPVPDSKPEAMPEPESEPTVVQALTETDVDLVARSPSVHVQTDDLPRPLPSPPMLTEETMTDVETEPEEGLPSSPLRTMLRRGLESAESDSEGDSVVEAVYCVEQGERVAGAHDENGTCGDEPVPPVVASPGPMPEPESEETTETSPAETPAEPEGEPDVGVPQPAETETAAPEAVQADVTPKPARQPELSPAPEVSTAEPIIEADPEPATAPAPEVPEPLSEPAPEPEPEPQPELAPEPEPEPEAEPVQATAPTRYEVAESDSSDSEESSSDLEQSGSDARPVMVQSSTQVEPESDSTAEPAVEPPSPHVTFSADTANIPETTPDPEADAEDAEDGEAEQSDDALPDPVPLPVETPVRPAPEEFNAVLGSSTSPLTSRTWSAGQSDAVNDFTDPGMGSKSPTRVRRTTMGFPDPTRITSQPPLWSDTRRATHPNNHAETPVRRSGETNAPMRAVQEYMVNIDIGEPVRRPVVVSSIEPEEPQIVHLTRSVSSMGVRPQSAASTQPTRRTRPQSATSQAILETRLRRAEHMASTAIPTGRLIAQPHKSVFERSTPAFSINRPSSTEPRRHLATDVELVPDSPMSARPHHVNIRPQSAKPTAPVTRPRSAMPANIDVVQNIRQHGIAPHRPASSAAMVPAHRIRPMSADLGARSVREAQQRALDIARRNNSEWGRYGLGQDQPDELSGWLVGDE